MNSWNYMNQIFLSKLQAGENIIITNNPMRNQKERRVLELGMMLSTTFIGSLQKLYHTFSKQPPMREQEKEKKKQRLSIQEKGTRQDPRMINTCQIP